MSVVIDWLVLYLPITWSFFFFFFFFFFLIKPKKYKVLGLVLVSSFNHLMAYQTAHSGQSVRQWSGRPGFNPRSSHTKDFKKKKKKKKWYLIPPYLTLSNIRYGSRVKWSNPGKGVAPSPTPWCSSYWKGSLWVALDNSGQLYFYLLNL